MKPPKYASIIDSLIHFAEATPEKRVYTILNKACEETDQVTFGALYQRVGNVAKNLIARGYSKGQPVALTASSGMEFITVFLGCLMAGVIPVPLPTPRGKRQMDRISSIFTRYGFHTVIADGESAVLFADQQHIQLVPSHILFEAGERCVLPKRHSEDLAFLQYTSGSTSQPKGVMVSHGNIMSNEAAIYSGFGHDSDTVILGWLPFHHDMGLIGNMLHPIYAGVPSVVMSPMDFLRNPASWLQMIHRYRATTSGGPNFAYDLCLAAIRPEHIEGVDLSSWRVAFNGSEMIQERTLSLFSRQFKPFGFSKKSFLFCYGLAEATLYVTGQAYQDDAIHRETHKANIACGDTEEDTELIVVNPESREVLEDQQEGEIWLRGSSVAHGYWQDEENTTAVFKAHTAAGEGPYLRTGDLGYWRKQQLHISGRLKNLMVIRGRNVHPVDIEAAIHDEYPQFAAYRTAIFSVRENDDDRVVIIQEIAKHKAEADWLQLLFEPLMARVASEFQVDVKAVMFVRENLLPRTTSGKIQVALARKMFLAGGFTAICSYVNETQVCADDSAPGFTVAEDRELNAEFIEQTVKTFLTLPYIDANKPLMEYGLDSLKAVRLSHTLADIGVDVSVAALLQGMKLTELCQQALSSQKALSSTTPDSLQDQMLSSAPLSLEQENIWIVQHINPDDCSYNIPVLLRVQGQQSEAELYQALSAVCASYTSLNTRFTEGESGIRQHCDGALEQPPISTLDLSALTEAEQQQAVQKRYDQQAQQAFVLLEEPSYRAQLIRCSDELSYVLLTIHHIACDGWSFNLFKRDFAIALNALRDDQMPQLGVCIDRSQFAYAQQQRDHLRDDSCDYGLNLLKGLTATPALSPLWRDTGHDTTSAPNGAELRKTLSTEQSVRLRQYCQQQGVSLASTLLGVFHALIHRYTGETDTAINYVGANRQSAHHRNAFACFVNTMVSRAQFEPDTSLNALCNAVQAQLNENFQHESYPFVALQRAAEQAGFDYGSPLSRYFFVMQNAPTGIDEITGLQIDLVPQANQYAMYDLVLEVLANNDDIELKLEYRRDAVPESLVQCYLATLEQLIECLGPEAIAIDQLAFSDQAQTLTPSLTDDWVVNHRFDVLQAIRARAQSHPERTALVDGARSLSYAELIDRVDQVSASLLQHPLAEHGQERSLTIVLPCVREAQYFINLLACLAVGACYVPLDLTQPESLIDDLLESVQADFILGRGVIPEILSKHQNYYVDAEQLALRDDAQRSALSPDPEQAAYLIFTSGSTGKPKGIRVSRRSLNSFVVQAIELFALTPHDRVLQFSALNWDTSSEEIFPCLARGACLVLRSQERVEPFAQLLALSEEHQISSWNIPSSYWQSLAQDLRQNQRQLPASLRLIIVGGEPLTEEGLRRWYQDHGTRVTLLNTYGATELTSISMAWDLRAYAQETSAHQHVPIGRPLANTKAYILNSDGQEVATGGVGLLHFSGPGLALDYHADETLTAQRFFVHPSLQQRLYNTGDYAYRDVDGTTYLIGRNDSYIKRRGVRIDLNMLSHAVQDLSGVEYAQAVAEKHGEKGNDITLYLSLHSGYVPETRRHIRMALEHSIPQHSQPDHIRFVTELPRLSNGKVDLQTLMQQSQTLFVDNDSDVAEPLSESLTEQAVAEVWRGILGHQNFSLNSAFNQVGGNSLLILQLKSALEDRFALEIPVTELFAQPTCRQQAAFIDRRRESNTTSTDQDLFSLLNALENDQVDLSTVKKTLNL
jgi:amino acid adenylation domain-containing protein